MMFDTHDELNNVMLDEKTELADIVTSTSIDPKRKH